MKNYLCWIMLRCLFGLSPLAAQIPADCATAFPLGDKSFLHFNVHEGIGKVKDALHVPCFMNGENFGQAETNSTWIYFKIKEAGELTFIISPDYPGDDIDFVLYQLPESGDCDHKKIVRCMAAGDSENAINSPCMGQTGLKNKEKDTSEDAGCSDSGDNNWLKPLDAGAGESYVLLVSNLTAPGGFVIYFRGSALLEPNQPPSAPEAGKE
ncbi:MAG: hypothetical protein ABIO24_06750 [Saprospiraceae bacterium]